MLFCVDIDFIKIVYLGLLYVIYNYFIDWLIIIILSNGLLYIF